VAARDFDLAQRVNAYLAEGALRRVGKLASFGEGLGGLGEQEADTLRARMLKQLVTLTECARNARDIKTLKGLYDDGLNSCKGGMY